MQVERVVDAGDEPAVVVRPGILDPRRICPLRAEVRAAERDQAVDARRELRVDVHRVAADEPAHAVGHDDHLPPLELGTFIC